MANKQKYDDSELLSLAAEIKVAGQASSRLAACRLAAECVVGLSEQEQEYTIERLRKKDKGLWASLLAHAEAKSAAGVEIGVPRPGAPGHGFVLLGGPISPRMLKKFKLEDEERETLPDKLKAIEAELRRLADLAGRMVDAAPPDKFNAQARLARWGGRQLIEWWETRPFDVQENEDGGLEIIKKK